LHRFAYFLSDNGSDTPALQGAHLLGADGVPLRGEIRQEGNLLVCQSRHDEPLGVSLLWPVKDFGTIQLETTRLWPRERPYHLHVELVRHRLMRISLKREEWGLFDYPGMEETSAKIDQARDLFIQALQAADDGPRVAELADQALTLACQASDRMCRLHAGVFLARRRQSGGFRRKFLGVSLPAGATRVKLGREVRDVFDFVRVPMVWRQIQPKEHGASFDAADQAIQAVRKAGLAVCGGPLLNFGVQFVPDWMYIWENDYDAISEFAREHIRRTVGRYAGKVSHWVVSSGLHAENVFPFNFEQIMDLTRTAATLTKQTDPRAQIVLDICQPWGEYYARNPQTIPPLLYADMAVQSGIPFDAFGLQFLFGIDSEGYHMRDLLQISTLIDRLANLGKSLYITAVAAPSTATQRGYWNSAWSEETQAEWLAAFCEVALSKPYVEGVCIHSLTDAGASGVPGGGLLRSDQTWRPAFERLRQLRRELTSGG